MTQYMQADFGSRRKIISTFSRQSTPTPLKWTTQPFFWSKLHNLFIFSGDRHRGGFYSFKTDDNNDIYEFTSSSLNLPIPFNTEEKGPLRIGSTYRKANFGVIRIFEDRVIMELTSNKGKVVNSLNVEFN